ncbi:MAG: PIN domain-containing protein [Magnetococcales bacterium]|nr:PIN domain-containing protein [Magnetococcales bacterium]
MMALICLDSCIVIYLVERHPVYAATLRQAMAGHARDVMSMSPLVPLEVLVKPIRDRDTATIRQFRQYLASLRMLTMPEEVFDTALGLRTDYGLRVPDALHLATAMVHGCTEFWTNDNRLTCVAPKLAINILKE